MSKQEEAYGSTIVEALAVLNSVHDTDDLDRLKNGVRAAMKLLENPSVPNAWDSRVFVAEGHPLTLSRVTGGWSHSVRGTFVVCEARKDAGRASLPLFVLTQEQLSDLIFAALTLPVRSHHDGFIGALRDLIDHKVDNVTRGVTDAIEVFLDSVSKHTKQPLRLEGRSRFPSSMHQPDLHSNADVLMENLLHGMRAKILPYAHSRHKVMVLKAKLSGTAPKEILEQAAALVADIDAEPVTKPKPRSKAKKQRSKMTK